MKIIGVFGLFSLISRQHANPCLQILNLEVQTQHCFSKLPLPQLIIRLVFEFCFYVSPLSKKKKHKGIYFKAVLSEHIYSGLKLDFYITSLWWSGGLWLIGKIRISEWISLSRLVAGGILGNWVCYSTNGHPYFEEISMQILNES